MNECFGGVVAHFYDIGGVNDTKCRGIDLVFFKFAGYLVLVANKDYFDAIGKVV